MWNAFESLDCVHMQMSTSITHIHSHTHTHRSSSKNCCAEKKTAVTFHWKLLIYNIKTTLVLKKSLYFMIHLMSFLRFRRIEMLCDKISIRWMRFVFVRIVIEFAKWENQNVHPISGCLHRRILIEIWMPNSQRSSDKCMIAMFMTDIEWNRTCSVIEQLNIKYQSIVLWIGWISVSETEMKNRIEVRKGGNE